MELPEEPQRLGYVRKGISLGKDDHVVRWPKPHIRGVGRAAQREMPRYVTVREARVHINTPGFRTKEVIIVTTLLDPIAYTKEDLAALSTDFLPTLSKHHCLTGAHCAPPTIEKYQAPSTLQVVPSVTPPY